MILNPLLACARVANMLRKYLRKIKKERERKYLLSFCVIDESSIIGDRFNINFNDDSPIISKKYIHIGKNCFVDGTFNFDSSNAEVIIGNNCYIGPSVFIVRENIIIEDYVVIAWGSIFYTHNSHSLNFMERRKEIKACYDALLKKQNMHITKTWYDVSAKPIVIKKDAWIGMNCIVLKGTTIGEGAIIGAGSLVAKNVESWTVVGGNPAKCIKKLSPFN